MKLTPLDFTPVVRERGGNVLLWEYVPYYSLGDGEQVPGMLRVHQFQDGILRDLTRNYCASILHDRLAPQGETIAREWDLATPMMRAVSRITADTGQITQSIAATRRAAISLVLQFFACGRAGDAARLAYETWPPSQAGRLLVQLRDGFRRSPTPRN
jgi:hypothetical protein